MTEGQTAARRQTLIGDCAAAFVLLSRFPTGWHVFPADNPPNFTSALWAFPLVGLVIGACGGLIFLAATALSLPPLMAAALALLATMLLSGGMHEDGLADMADGFGGGKDVEARIRIMHDSRIGSFGVMALILASLARVGLLMAAALHATGLTLVLLLALVYAAARFLPVLQLSIIPVSPHARLASLTGNGGVWRAVTGLAVWAVPLIIAFSWQVAIPAAALSCLLAVIIARMALRRVAGLTGDVMGATILLGEITILAGCLMTWELLALPIPMMAFMAGMVGT